VFGQHDESNHCEADQSADYQCPYEKNLFFAAFQEIDPLPGRHFPPFHWKPMNLCCAFGHSLLSVRDLGFGLSGYNAATFLSAPSRRGLLRALVAMRFLRPIQELIDGLHQLAAIRSQLIDALACYALEHSLSPWQQ
jgi:hypothetical protein